MGKKYISKIAAIILISALLILTAVPAFAADKTVKVKVEIAGSDGKLYVRLTAPAESDISTFEAYLKFDSEKLEYSEMSYLDDKNVISSTPNDEYLEDSSIIGAGTLFAASLKEESKIFTYVFNILDSAEGDCHFQITVTEAENSNGDRLNIAFDGPLTVSLTSLEPLTPDKLQSSYEPATTPANGSENAGSPNIPNTTKKVIAVSAAAVVAVAAIAGTAVFLGKKKKASNVDTLPDESEADEENTDNSEDKSEESDENN